MLVMNYPNIVFNFYGPMYNPLCVLTRTSDLQQKAVVVEFLLFVYIVFNNFLHLYFFV